MVLQTRLFRFFSVFLWNARYQIQYIIEHFRRYVTERLLNTKVVVFLVFLWFAPVFVKILIRPEKCGCI